MSVEKNQLLLDWTNCEEMKKYLFVIFICSTVINKLENILFKL